MDGHQLGPDCQGVRGWRVTTSDPEGLCGCAWSLGGRCVAAEDHRGPGALYAMFLPQQGMRLRRENSAYLSPRIDRGLSCGQGQMGMV
jgi:hypothetical protein